MSNIKNGSVVMSKKQFMYNNIMYDSAQKKKNFNSYQLTTDIYYKLQ